MSKSKRNDLFNLKFSKLPNDIFEHDFHVTTHAFTDSAISDSFMGKIFIKWILIKSEEALKLEIQTKANIKAPCDRCLQLIEDPVIGHYEQWFYFDRSHLVKKNNVFVTLLPNKETELYLENEIKDTLLLSVPVRKLCKKNNCKIPSYPSFSSDDQTAEWKKKLKSIACNLNKP